MTRRIEAQWQSFFKILPSNAGPAQIQETRRAFYAGANALFATILNSLEPGTEPTDADLKMMDEIHAEFKDFAERLKRGEV